MSHGETILKTRRKRRWVGVVLLMLAAVVVVHGVLFVQCLFFLNAGPFPPSPNSRFVHSLTLEFIRLGYNAQDVNKVITEEAFISLARKVVLDLGLKATVSPVGHVDDARADDVYLVDYRPLTPAEFMKAEDIVIFAVRPPRIKNYWFYVDETGAVRKYHNAVQMPKRFAGSSASELRNADR